jgi:hypothetical protein
LIGQTGMCDSAIYHCAYSCSCLGGRQTKIQNCVLPPPTCNSFPQRQPIVTTKTPHCHHKDTPLSPQRHPIVDALYVCSTHMLTWAHHCTLIPGHYYSNPCRRNDIRVYNVVRIASTRLWRNTFMPVQSRGRRSVRWSATDSCHDHVGI